LTLESTPPIPYIGGQPPEVPTSMSSPPVKAQDRRAEANTISKVASDIATAAKQKLADADVANLDEAGKQALFAEVRALADQAQLLQNRASTLANSL
jgi:hypothetical protein